MRKAIFHVGAVGLLTLGAACSRHDTVVLDSTAAVNDVRLGAADEVARLHSGMGSHRRAITTTSSAAQRYFDHGLVWMYAFNHDEAIRCFRGAIEHDPACAMAWWGIAVASGPHINNPAMDEERCRIAWAAAVRADELSAGCTPTERALIAAARSRYSPDPKAERRPLDEAYAGAMREVWRRFPGDADVGVLYAESMMDLRPWDLWERSNARTLGPKEGTTEIVATLDRALELNPEHPGANHLYIHTMEASAEPEKAVAAADRLRTLVPRAGHLVHMPSHIDIRVGRWADASRVNEAAIRADDRYTRQSGKQGFYRVYMAHNHHFLAFASMMEGRSAAGLAAADAMVAGVPPEFLESSAALVDPVMSIRIDVMKRFGMWDRILSEPEPDARLPITRCMWRLSRAISLAAKGEPDRAMEERARFLEARGRVSKDAMMTINPAHTVLDIGQHLLDAEIALAKKDHATAIRELEAGVKIEDTLVYMEPPDWLQPLRHTLGAVLLEAGRAADAEMVYREDLRIWPENAWSLLGLRDSLREQGKSAEARAIAARVDKAWERADTRPGTTCLCVQRSASN